MAVGLLDDIPAVIKLVDGHQVIKVRAHYECTCGYNYTKNASNRRKRHLAVMFGELEGKGNEENRSRAGTAR